MRRHLSGIAALSITAFAVTTGAHANRTNAAPTTPGPALAYVTAGQVAVIEGGNLTVAGPGENPSWSPNGANLLFDTPDLLANVATVYISDTHGANTRALLTHVYPAINPSWSPDSKYVVYTVVAPGKSATGRTVQLLVKAIPAAGGGSRTLGHFTFGAGCSIKSTALQATFTKAQGGYHGTPSTLIWAQPNLVVVQSSCTGQGLTELKVSGGSTHTLAGWSGGVLSPDRKTVAAAVAGAAGKSARVGTISVSNGTSKVLPAKISPGSFAWQANSQVLFTVSQPSNTVTGAATLYRMSPDGKEVAILGQTKAAGIFHLSLNQAGTHLAMAVVGNAATNVGAPPVTIVDDAAAMATGTGVPLVQGEQPAWRP
jgi:Tol biopolymer transport system component